MARGVTTMRGSIGRWRALANAGFAVAVLALAGFGLYQVAGRHWRVQPTFHVRARFDDDRGPGSGRTCSRPGDRRRRGRDDRRARRAGPAGRARPCGSTNGSGSWSAPTRWRGSSPRAWSGPRRSSCRRAAPMRPAVAELDTIASERPIEMGDLLKQAAATLERLDAASHAPPSKDLARSTRSPARSAAAREAWASWCATTRSITTSSIWPIAASEQPDGPRGEPDRSQADLADLALLRPPGLSRPRTGAVPAGLAAATAAPSAPTTSSSPADRS